MRWLYEGRTISAGNSQITQPTVGHWCIHIFLSKDVNVNIRRDYPSFLRLVIDLGRVLGYSVSQEWKQWKETWAWVENRCLKTNDGGRETLGNLVKLDSRKSWTLPHLMCILSWHNKEIALWHAYLLTYPKMSPCQRFWKISLINLQFHLWSKWISSKGCERKQT